MAWCWNEGTEQKHTKALELGPPNRSEEQTSAKANDSRFIIKRSFLTLTPTHPLSGNLKDLW